MEGWKRKIREKVKVENKCWSVYCVFMPIWFEFGLWDFWTIVMNELTYWQTDSCSQDLVVVSLVWHLVVKYAYYGVDYTKPTKCHRLGFWSWSVVKSLKLRSGWNFEAQVWLRVWSWGVVEILKLKFGQEFEAEVWLKCWSWSLVKSLRLRCVPDFGF